jgi:Domain of unknown function (DUF4907)
MVILMSLLMQKRGVKNGSTTLSVLFLLLSDYFLLFSGCKNNPGEIEKKSIDGNMVQVTLTEVTPSFVKYRSFQNPDSSWGYTVFVNSKPYLHYSRIPLVKGGSGYPTREDADMVAGIIVRMIQNGNMSPKLNKRITDSLISVMNINSQMGK